MSQFKSEETSPQEICPFVSQARVASHGCAYTGPYMIHPGLSQD